MTITTKQSTTGRISAYYVDGAKVRKNEIDFSISDAAAKGEIIYVDYYIGQEFRAITRSPYKNLKVVFTGIDELIMTQAAADELGAKIIEGFSGAYYGLKVFRVEMPSEVDVEDYAVTPEAQDVAIEAEIIAAGQKAVADYIKACDEETAKKYEAEIQKWFALSTPQVTIEAQDAALEAETELANAIAIEDKGEKLIAALIDEYAVTPAALKIAESTEILNALWAVFGIGAVEKKNAEIQATSINEREKLIAELKADGYNFVVTTNKVAVDSRTLPTNTYVKTYENALHELKLQAKFYAANPNCDGGFVFATLDGELIAKGIKIADYEQTLNTKDNTNAELSEELIEEYIISAEAKTVALRTELANAELAKGNFSTVINGEYVFFADNQIVRIDAANKLGLIFSRHNRKKQFFMVATQAGRVIQGSMKAIAAGKVADRYMAKETANEQDKFFHNFFDAHKIETGKFFSVVTYIIYADGYEHIFERQFDYFNQAQNFVGEVKKVIGDAPTQIFIKRNQQGEKLYYHRKADGIETYNLPETLFFQIFPKDIQGRIDELNQAIADNQAFIDQLIAEQKNGYMWICESLVAARENLKKTVDYYEFILHETEPYRPFTIAETIDVLTDIIDDFKAQRKAATDPATIAELDENITDVTKERQKLINKLNPADNRPVDDEPITTINTQTNAPNNSTPDKQRDSLARGMKECLFNIQKYCRNNDINAACYELELYNICSQGLRDTGQIA